MTNTVTLYKCSNDRCGRVLLSPEDGLVIHGNIYVADPTTRGGLIGNNFPKPSEPTPTGSIDEIVKETVLCVSCFMKTCLPKLRITTMR